MAKVNMDLAELKQLESKIEKLEKDKQDLIDKQHQVVVYHKYFNGRIKAGSFPKGNIHRVDSINISGQSVYTNYEGSAFAYFNRDIPLQQALDAGLIEIDIMEDSSRHTKDYINMSEAISQIRQEEEDKVKESLQQVLERATKAEYDAATIEDKYKKKILESTDYYNNRISQLHETYNIDKQALLKKHDSEKEALLKDHSEILEQKNRIIDIIEADFAAYKEDKKRLSLEEQIVELTRKLQEYENKSFWQRITNT